jgi:hypothetical protein
MQSIDPYRQLQEITSRVLRRTRFSLRISYKGKIICYDNPRWLVCDYKPGDLVSSEGPAPGDSTQTNSENSSDQMNEGQTKNKDLSNAHAPSGDQPVDLSDSTHQFGSSVSFSGALSTAGSIVRSENRKLPRPLNTEFLATLKKRLRDNPDAIKHLTGSGLTDEAIEQFNLGLSKPYRNAAGQVQADALVYPVKASDGRFYKYGYITIPGVTKHGVKDSWIAGPVLTYYSDSVVTQRKVFVCGDAKDVWRTWQALKHTDHLNSLLLISTTDSSDYPSEWRKQEFWRQWEVIYFALSGSPDADALSADLTRVVPGEARRVRMPGQYGASWSDFWQNGGTLREFERLLVESSVVSQELKPADDLAALGRFSYVPVDINGAFHQGRLYYAVRTIHREMQSAPSASASSAIVECLDTVVIRSDRTVHTASWMPSPRGTPQQDRVLRLSDGTLLAAEPRASKYATWSWPSIKAFLDGKSKTRSLADILGDVTAYLRENVWLPCEEDYSILALAVPVTYAQAIFDSVPLLFLNGPPGSGKSQTGRVMARVCANAYICGQTSAASVARFIDESRGFVVLDDLEAIGSKGGEYGELVQALKQSYNKETAIKLWTDVKSMQTRRLNFFGVKMINNTRGAGPILSSRMLRIQTGKMPDHLRERFQDLRGTGDKKLGALRDELHTWAFENVSVIEARYRSLFPAISDRAEEIAAPLKVIAALAGDGQLSKHLDVALSRQAMEASEPEDPARVIMEALRVLVREGYRSVSVTHLTLEARRILRESYGRHSELDMPEWATPGAIGRHLRVHELIDPDPAKLERRRVFGANLRIYPIHNSFVDEVAGYYQGRGIDIEAATRQAGDFCRSCESCAYSNLGCQIMRKRLKPAPRSARGKLLGSGV